jgi:hypothetical protein
MRNIENVVLTTFLFSEDYNTPGSHFELEAKYFSSPFKQELARSINYALEQNRSMRLILDRLMNTAEAVEIVGALPLHSFERAKEYYEVLIKNYKIKVMRSLI